MQQTGTRFFKSSKLMAGARMTRGVWLGLLPLLLVSAAGGATGPVRIGTSEFIYSDLAQQIGGAAVSVRLLDRGTAAAHGGNSAAGSDLVICSGMAADAWLRDAARKASPQPVVFEALRYAAVKPDGASLPVYDPNAISAVAQDVAKELSRRMPARSSSIAANLARYTDAVGPINRKMEEIARIWAGTDVFLTDARLRGLVERLHFKIQDGAYIKELQSGIAASPKSVAELKDAITEQKASILFYDRDAATDVTNELVALANDAGIPVVGLGEKLPSGLHYQQWMLRQLNAIRGALNEASP
jgi:zinc/manganese transport system substrate-binding protein